MLISTHQTEDVAALCDRVMVLDAGRVRFDGAVVDLVGHRRRTGVAGRGPGRRGSGLVAHRHRAVPQRR